MTGSCAQGHPMLAEKFFLILETIICHTNDSVPAKYPDVAPKVVSKRQHIPIRLPELDLGSGLHDQTKIQSGLMPVRWA